MTANTATAAFVREFADNALTRPKGLAITFTTTRLGSLHATKLAARSFQQMFSSIRAKDRRKVMNEFQRKYESRDTFVEGKYDKLACVRLPLPEDMGWTVQLIPHNMVNMNADITDLATGEDVAQYSEAGREITRLRDIWLDEFHAHRHQHRRFINPWKAEEIAFFWKREPYFAAMMYDGVHLPHPGAEVKADVLDDDFGEGEDEQETAE